MISRIQLIELLENGPQSRGDSDCQWRKRRHRFPVLHFCLLGTQSLMDGPAPWGYRLKAPWTSLYVRWLMIGCGIPHDRFGNSGPRCDLISL